MCQKTKVKDCRHCSESFEAKRKNHYYCSASCRVMACYKRKGYTYVSGHYKKPQLETVGEVLVYRSVSVSPEPPETSAKVPVGKQQLTTKGVDAITVTGIAENAIGSGIVATAKYLMHDMPMMELIKELHEVLVALPRRISQQQAKQMAKGMNSASQNQLQQSKQSGHKSASNQPLSNQANSAISQQLNTKRLGIDPNPFKSGEMMMGT